MNYKHCLRSDDIEIYDKRALNCIRIPNERFTFCIRERRARKNMAVDRIGKSR